MIFISECFISELFGTKLSVNGEGMGTKYW